MDEPPYEVGYCKPPKATQFRSGVSGNPSGKRKAPPSFSETLDRILAEKVDVSERGQARRMTREEVFLRQMVAKAMACDRQFGKVMLDYLQRRQLAGPVGSTSETDEYLLSELMKLFDGDSK